MGNERAFLKTASSRFSKSEAEELLGKLKTAGIVDAAKGALGPYKHEIAAGALGAATAVGLQYLTSKRNKDGKALVEKALTEPEEKDRSSMSFAEDLMHAKDKAMADYAGVSARHPGKSSMFVAPAGVGLGLGALTLLRRLKGV